MTKIVELIENYFKSKIGFDFASTGIKNVERILNYRMSALGINDQSKYFQTLQNYPAEEQSFIEMLVVPETWFFRDMGGIKFLVDHVTTKWQLIGEKKHLRILSVPCSSGEEPYSIAICLLEAGIKSSTFSIDAIDINKNSLLKAKRGVYTKNSFREKNLIFSHQYFDVIDDQYVIKPQVSQNVNFAYGNIINPNFDLSLLQYDFIFCRNFLFYLTKKAQKRVFSLIDKLLQPGGIVITSPAETDLFRGAGFISMRYPLACAFLKRKSAALVNASDGRNFNTSRHQLVKEKSSSSTHVIFEKKESKESLIEKASCLADRGQLDEATDLCLTHIQENSIDAKGYFLLGLIFQTKGDDSQAEEFLRKTIYLEPNHYEALISLALLLKNKGDKKQAELYRIRAAKVIANKN